MPRQACQIGLRLEDPRTEHERFRDWKARLHPSSHKEERQNETSMILACALRLKCVVALAACPGHQLGDFAQHLFEGRINAERNCLTPKHENSQQNARRSRPVYISISLNVGIGIQALCSGVWKCASLAKLCLKLYV